MQLEELKPEHVENATMADLEALGLPPDVVSAIAERGLQFNWDASAGRYVPEIPKS